MCNYLLTEISSVVCNIDDSFYVCSIVTKQEKRKPGNEATPGPHGMVSPEIFSLFIIS